MISRQEKMTLAALVIALVAIGALYFCRKNIELFSNRPVVTYYYMKGCPWCEKFMPEWDKFVVMAKSANVSTKKIEASEDPDTVQRLGIKGFPTIMIENGKKSVEYSGERTADAIMKTVKSSLNVV